MTGTVDSLGRALLRVRLQHPQSAGVVEMDAWIDTGFTGELVIPQQQIAALGLPLGPVVKAILADGSQIDLATYHSLEELTAIPMAFGRNAAVRMPSSNVISCSATRTAIPRRLSSGLQKSWLVARSYLSLPPLEVALRNGLKAGWRTIARGLNAVRGWAVASRRIQRLRGV